MMRRLGGLWVWVSVCALVSCATNCYTDARWTTGEGLRMPGGVQGVFDAHVVLVGAFPFLSASSHRLFFVLTGIHRTNRNSTARACAKA
ncbi:hypothetical protein B0H11DRAFT_48683 [Mycena galericulata]|nr:hypothetical protein B0H11DRAFT_48683 [Mycena galericulata]